MFTRKPFAIGQPPALTAVQKAILAQITARNPVLVAAALPIAVKHYESAPNPGTGGLGQSTGSGSGGGFWSSLTSTISSLTPDFVAYEQSQSTPAYATAQTNQLLAQNGVGTSMFGGSGFLGLSMTDILLIGGLGIVAFVMIGKKKRAK